MQVIHLVNPRNKFCSNCGKQAVAGFNKPHSLHKTKRTIKPNLQKFKNKLVCTNCLKKLRNYLR